MRPQEDIDAAAHDDYVLSQLKTKGTAASEFAAAIEEARTVCESAGLNATFDNDGQPVFTTFQTAKATRHMREDASATLMLQFSIMRRLDRNRNLMLLIIFLLIYIAFSLK